MKRRGQRQDTQEAEAQYLCNELASIVGDGVGRMCVEDLLWRKPTWLKPVCGTMKDYAMKGIADVKVTEQEK